MRGWSSTTSVENQHEVFHGNFKSPFLWLLPQSPSQTPILAEWRHWTFVASSSLINTPFSPPFPPLWLENSDALQFISVSTPHTTVPLWLYYYYYYIVNIILAFVNMFSIHDCNTGENNWVHLCWSYRIKNVLTIQSKLFLCSSR